MTEFEKFFVRRGKGGYSNCLDRGQGYVIPNCVGFAWGMFYYFHGKKKTKAEWDKHPTGNANTLYAACRKDGSGFWVNVAVKENAILCYNVGDYGHVVYCLYKQPDGKYLCAESNYSGTVKNGRYIRYIVCDNPAVLYKGFQGSIYDFT